MLKMHDMVRLDDNPLVIELLKRFNSRTFLVIEEVRHGRVRRDDDFLFFRRGADTPDFTVKDARRVLRRNRYPPVRALVPRPGRSDHKVLAAGIEV